MSDVLLKVTFGRHFFWMCVCGPTHRLLLTAQPREVMAVVYHHTLVKLHITPSTTAAEPKYCIQHIQYVQNLHSNKFLLHISVHFTLYM